MRDSKSYATVQIGTQCWMAQGLNVGTRINGSVTQDGWSGTTCTSIDKYCYSDTDANCDSNNNPNYPDGGLYQWDQAMCGSTTEGAQGICPTGWHIPTDAQWYTLESYLWETGDCLSSRTTAECSPAADKLEPGGSSGFEGNFAGFLLFGMGTSQRTTVAWYWSSTQIDASNAWRRNFDSSNPTIQRYNHSQADGFSIRCIKD